MHVQGVARASTRRHDDQTCVRRTIDKSGITIISVASVLGGFGGGGSASAANRPVGGGLGLGGTPAGMYATKGETLSWQPAMNLNRVILSGQIVAIVLLLTVRSIVRARVVRLPRTGCTRRSFRPRLARSVGTGAPVKSPGAKAVR
jgi:hypothetical protein